MSESSVEQPFGETSQSNSPLASDPSPSTKPSPIPATDKFFDEQPLQNSPSSSSPSPNTPPVVPRRISSSSRKSLRKSLRDSLLISLQQQKTSPAPSRRISQSGNNNNNGSSPLQKTRASQSFINDDEPSQSKVSSARSSFPMIPSLRNSPRSSVNSNLKSKKNSISKDINSIMEIYDLISVKDFGYPASNSLHYGLSNYELYLNNQSSSQLDSYYHNYSTAQNDFSSYYNDEQEFSPGDNLEDSQELGVEVGQPVHKAIALFDFHAENDNELELREGQIINILYEHGQGWLVGEDIETSNTGLIPEEYVELVFDNEEEEAVYGERLDQIADDVFPIEKQLGTSDHISEQLVQQQQQQQDTENVDNDNTNGAFSNARSQLNSPTELSHKITSHTMTESQITNNNDDQIEARTTQITGSPLSNYEQENNKPTDSFESLDRDNESNYTLNQQNASFTVNGNGSRNGNTNENGNTNINTDNTVNNNRPVSVTDSENHDHIDNRLATSNYLKFLENSSTTPNPIIDRTADSSGSDKFSNELESETSDLQIDNYESKPFLPEIFRVNSVNSSSVNNNADSPLSMTNSVSYPRFIHKRSLFNANSNYNNNSSSNNNNANNFLFFNNTNNSMRNSSGYSSGSNSLINGKSGLHHSSSLNSNLNLNLTFGNGSPTTAVLTGTAVSGPHAITSNRRGSSLLFGGGLIQSKSTNSINLKMTAVSSMMSIPRSSSLSKSFGGSVNNEDLTVEDMTKFKPPNLLSKDNYFMNGIAGTTSTSATAANSKNNTAINTINSINAGSASLNHHIYQNTSVMLRDNVDDMPASTVHKFKKIGPGPGKAERKRRMLEEGEEEEVAAAAQAFAEKKEKDDEEEESVADDDDFWIDDEFKSFQEKFNLRAHGHNISNISNISNDDIDFNDLDNENDDDNEIEGDKNYNIRNNSLDNDHCITPVTSTPVTAIRNNEISNNVGSLLTSRLPKSLTMKSISGHHHSKRHSSHGSHGSHHHRSHSHGLHHNLNLTKHQHKRSTSNASNGIVGVDNGNGNDGLWEKKRGFTRALSRKFSKIRLKSN